MGIKQDTEDSLKDFEFTKIDGQPTDEDLNQLTKECINAAASISTTNGGGQHGHVGMIIDDAEYILFSHNAARFVTPTNPGPYPATVDPDAAIQILAYLRAHGGDLDHLDVTELIQQLQKDWDHVEAPATLFARGDKIEGQLVKAGQAANPPLRLAFALATFEASGEFEPSIREWKAKPVADRTFTKFRIFMQKAFTDRNKHNKSTAQSTGRGIVNSATDVTMGKVDEAEAAALAIAEVAMVMQSNQEKQFKQMMEMFKELMQANVPGAPSQASVPTQSKQRKVCPHCKRPHAKPDKCWELDANKADRPANWKPAAERQPKS
eukprot:g4040.t1 g4040   contig15:204992-206117(-)